MRDHANSQDPAALIRPEQSIFVIIDVQERLVPVISEKELVIQNIIRLTRFSRIINVPILLTEQERLGGTLPEVGRVIPEVQAVSKHHFNCFGSEVFREKIKGSGRSVLILAGIEAHICVLQTALSALSEFRVHVVSDAVSSRAPHNREVALKRMAQSGVTITSTETVIYELLEKAGTPAFRKALALVK
ncbi:MAG: isochorismatase family protein [Desulfatiglandaceae bacterium]|jgi:isochorismate hydrolase